MSTDINFIGRERRKRKKDLISRVYIEHMFMIDLFRRTKTDYE